MFIEQTIIELKKTYKSTEIIIHCNIPLSVTERKIKQKIRRYIVGIQQTWQMTPTC